ncbi:hypothetical protein OKA05_26080 [Luteolibacter arcticus]|uniref:Uncharacterized protein n=1 Tax=Luteolibacter arcticus TaxID=1581411 RepID=A0ABT3GRC9_9BACT|nr:hypothetical protein [Luteolibacter arcticus]MCW1926055.1 hypothetical protein [Luteolibacter arcticus]
MILSRPTFAAALGALLACLPVTAQQAEKPEIPADLLEDAHVREELAINEFTAPSIAKIFESLEALAPLPFLKFQRETPATTPLDRADLAVELGFLIADGFLVVQAGELGKVEKLAADMTRYGKALGAGERVNRHAASLLESARKQDIAQLKMELRDTQKDVELELVALRDADLAHLISMGGWIRALQVSSSAVQAQFSPERAKHVMREDIADYYSAVVGSLNPRISERPTYLEMRDLFAGLRTEMTVAEGEQVTQSKVAEITKQAAKLAELALRRDEGP